VVVSTQAGSVARWLKFRLRHEGAGKFAATPGALLGLAVVVAGCSGSGGEAAAERSKNTEATESDLTTKVFERDADGDGKPDSRYETYRRGQEKVLTVISRADDKGVLTVRSRSYRVNGQVVFTEVDEDGDGVFESLVAQHPDGDALEVFVRENNGTVRPASSRVVELRREQFAAIENFFSEAFDESGDTNNFPALMRKTQQEIQETEAEIRRQ